MSVDINCFATDVETTFNMIDSIPMLGAFPSAARVTMGQVQFCAGFVFGLIGLAGCIVSPRSGNWEDLKTESFRHAYHGALNVIRGTCEVVLSGSVVGGICSLIIQATTNRFAPIVPYSFPKPPPEYIHIPPSCPIIYEV